MRRAIFVHVFKAGGTTVSDWLDRHYRDCAVPAAPYDFQNNRDRYLNARLIRGHLCLRDALPAPGRVLFTMVRKPEAQVMSALWHLVSKAEPSREHRPFDPSVDLAAKAREFSGGRLSQYRFFELTPNRAESAINGLSRLHAVGLTERLQDSLRLFAWRLHLPAPRDVSHARDSGAGQVAVPAEIAEILAEGLEHDRRLYRAAAVLFEQDFAALCKAADGQYRIDDYLDRRAARVGRKKLYS